MYIRLPRQYTEDPSSLAGPLAAIIPLLFFSITFAIMRCHVNRRLDEGRTPVRGTRWLGEFMKSKREDDAKEAIRKAEQAGIKLNPTPSQTTTANDPLPGIQEIDGHVSERSRLQPEIGEMEASQTGAGAWPYKQRYNSVRVNEVPVELPAEGRDEEEIIGAPPRVAVV